MKGFMKSIKVPNMKMSPLSQFIFLLAILVLSLLLKSAWDYWMNRWNLTEGFDNAGTYTENSTITNMTYYSNDSKKLYVLNKDSSGNVLFVDLDNGLLLKYKIDDTSTTRTYPVYRREYGSEATITISGELSENQSTELSRIKNISLYNNGYMKTFLHPDVSNTHLAYMPFGNGTLVHLFDDNKHIKTRFFDGNKNVYPSGTADDPGATDSYLPGKTPVATATTTATTTATANGPSDGDYTISGEDVYTYNGSNWIKAGTLWSNTYSYADGDLVTYATSIYKKKNSTSSISSALPPADESENWNPIINTGLVASPVAIIEHFTTMTTEKIGSLGYQNELFRVDTGVYLDPANGYLVLYDSTSGKQSAYENDGTKIADPALVQNVARTGFNGWAVNGLTDDYFVVYMDTSIKTMVAKIQLTNGEWKISKILRLEDGKVKTSDESLTETGDSGDSANSGDSTIITGSGQQCKEGHLEMKMAGLTMCVPTAQFFGAMFGGQSSGSSSSNGYGSEFIRKTEVVPPVCPQCPQCPGHKNGEVCSECGGNGGSGTKRSKTDKSGTNRSKTDNSVGSLVRSAGEGGTSLTREAGGGAASLARDATGGAARIGTNAVTGAIGLGTNAINGTTNLATNTVTGTVGLGREIVDGAGNVVSGAASAVGNGIGSVGRGIGNLGNGGYQQQQQQQQQGGVYGQGYGNSYGGPNINRNVPPGMDPYSYYGAVPPRASCNYMPRTADFSSFGR
jgi:hypothetical protein